MCGPALQKLGTSRCADLKKARESELRDCTFPAVHAPKTSGGVGRAHDPKDVTVELVTKELSGWIGRTAPPATRNSARPGGQDSINAMCLGMRKPYFAAVLAFRRTRLLPTATKLCTQFGKNTLDDEQFKYTIIQLNYNSNAETRANKHNRGPSHIIGLGD